MTRAVLGRIAAALVLAVACQRADDDGEPTTNGAQNSGGSAGTENTVTAAGATEIQAGAVSALGGAGSVVEPEPSGGLPTMAGQGGAGPPEHAAGGACGTGAEDGECARCLATQCCTEWQACELHEDCDACSACLDAQMDLGECVVMNLCDIAPEATSKILLCGLEPCEQECGFD